ncbi:MAG: PKD domain-containing protein [Flavobacteriales bacterium]|nr:PKD domain-containing protein [Flavobacteriales bacterium]
MINKIKYLLLFCFIGASFVGFGQATSKFSIDGATTGCEQLAVDFIDLSTLAEDWVWDFGDGETLEFELGNPSPSVVSHTYDEPGLYTVSLTINGTLVFPLEDAIEVYKPPTPAFSVDITDICANKCVQYTDESIPGDGEIIAWAWIFFDGTGSPDQHAEQCYTYFGLWNTLLSVEDDNGCIKSFEKADVVNVKELPTPIITALNIQYVPDNTFNFNGSNSIGSGLNYSWDFGESGSTSNTATATSPNHTYIDPDDYTVELTLKNGEQCESTTTVEISLQEIDVDFNTTSNIVEGCTPLLIDFLQQTTTSSNLPIIDLTYKWDFGDPASGTDNFSNIHSPSHGYTETGSYTVTLEVYTPDSSNGGIFTETKTSHIVVHDRLEADFTVDKELWCVGYEATYTDITPNLLGWTDLEWEWDMSNGEWNDDPDNPGDYTTEYDYSKDYNVQNPAHTYTFPPRYWEGINTFDSDTIMNVSLIVSSPSRPGCADTIIKDDFIKIVKPLADFHITNDVFKGCTPLKIYFRDSSTYAPPFTDEIVKWTWDFGDGTAISGGDEPILAGGNTTCTYKTPAHVYTDPGIYNPQLIIETANGCTDTVRLSQTRTCLAPNGKTITERFCAVEVGQKPTSNFTVVGPLEGCLPLIVSFTNESDAWATENYWDFGTNGRYIPSCSNGPLIQRFIEDALPVPHSYDQLGTFTVRLYSVHNGCVGDTAIIEDVITTKGAKPMFDLLTSTNGRSDKFCTGDTLPTGGWQVIIADSSQNTDIWLWSMGDSSSTKFEDSLLTFDGVTYLGDYKHRIDMETDTVFIEETTVWVYKDTLITSIADADTNSYTVYAGGNFNDTTYIIYLQPETLIVSKDESFEFGCNYEYHVMGDTIFLNDTVHTKNYTDRYLYDYTGITFTYFEDIIADSIVARFPDYLLTIPRDSILFGVGVKDSLYPACDDTTAILTDIGVCNSNFQPTGMYMTDSVMEFYLDSNRAIPFKHVFTTPGRHDITLYAWNEADDCFDLTSKTIRISQIKPGFEQIGTGCGSKDTLMFLDTSVSEYPIVEFKWYFGDGVIAVGDTVSMLSVNMDGARTMYKGDSVGHIYKEPGEYLVKLITTDIYGCKDTTLEMKIRVNPIPQIGFVASRTYGCINDYVNDNLSVKFIDTVSHTGTIVQRYWDFGDTKNDSSEANISISHQYDSVGVFDIIVTVVDYLGCSDTDTIFGMIETSNPTANFIYPTLGCGNGEYEYESTSANVAGTATYIWNWCDTSDVDTTTSMTINHTYGPDSALYSPQLLVIDSFGCIDTIRQSVKISDPLAHYRHDFGLDPCEGTVYLYDTSIYAASDEIDKYTWTTTHNGILVETTNEVNPQFSLPIGDTTFIKLAFVTDAGCRDSITKGIFAAGVQGTASIEELNDCSPKDVRFSLNDDTVNVHVVSWDFGDGIRVNSFGEPVTHTYTNAGSFDAKIILYDTLGNCNYLYETTIGVAGPLVSLSTLGDPNACSSGTYVIDAHIDQGTPPSLPTYSYIFGFGDPSSSDNNIEGTTKDTDFSESHFYANPGTYDVAIKVSHSTGECYSIDTARNLVFIAVPEVEISFPDTGCIPFDAQFILNDDRVNTANFSITKYEWDFEGDGYFDNSNDTTTTTAGSVRTIYNESGEFHPVVTMYYDNLTSGTPCEMELSERVVAGDLPEAGFSSEPEIEGGNIYIPFYNFYNESTGAVTYEWSFDDPNSGEDSISTLTNPIHRFEILRDYNVKLVAISELGCRDTIINPEIIDIKLKFQNIITPNGDGINDNFILLERTRLTRQLKFTVFNRWGQMVFNDDDYTEDWDGKGTNDELLSEDTYYYILNYDDKVSWTGWVFINYAEQE